MFLENQEVMTPRGKGHIVYIEDDFVSVELTNGAEMDFDVSDLSADIVETNTGDREFDYLNISEDKRVRTATVIEIMSARADSIMSERHDVLKGHLRHISGALGKKNTREILKVFDYVEAEDVFDFPLHMLHQEWKQELFLYALFLGGPPSTLSNLEKDAIKQRYLDELNGFLSYEETRNP